MAAIRDEEKSGHQVRLSASHESSDNDLIWAFGLKEDKNTLMMEPEMDF